MKIPNSIKWGVFGVVAILAVVFLMRSCNLYDEVSVLKGKHEALRIAYADMDLKSKATIEAHKADIAARDEVIDEAGRTIIDAEGKIEDKDKKILRLEEAFTQLGENKDAKIINLQAQVSIWKEKFTLAQEIIAKKDTIIFSLTAKYDAQVKISTEWEASYYRQVELHQIALDRISVMEKKWVGINLGSNAKTGLIIGLILYLLVKS